MDSFFFFFIIEKRETRILVLAHLRVYIYIKLFTYQLVEFSQFDLYTLGNINANTQQADLVKYNKYIILDCKIFLFFFFSISAKRFIEISFSYLGFCGL